MEVETDGKPGTIKDLGPVNYQAVCLPTDWDHLMVEDEKQVVQVEIETLKLFQ